VAGDFVDGRFSKKFSGSQINKGKGVRIHQRHLIRQNKEFKVVCLLGNDLKLSTFKLVLTTTSE
jgi:hypothetical protein